MILFLAGCSLRPAGEILDPPADSVDTSAPLTGCGNGTVDEPHEECDVHDDDACPGQCSHACQCPSMPATGVLSVYMIDVWQGDGLAIVSPDGFAMLLDAGDEGTWDHYSQFLQGKGINNLDYTLVSHQHTDHMGAMDLALKAHPEVGVAWDGGGTASSQGYRDYVAAAGDRRTTVQRGDTLDLGPSMKAEILHSDIGDRDNENNNSVVLRLTYGDFRMLLGGDCESEVCESAFDPGPVNVYKVHHHGSSDSSSDTLLSEMGASDALISVGAGNDYGHPHQETLNRLAAHSMRVWRTDENGDLGVTSDGSTFTVAPE